MTDETIHAWEMLKRLGRSKEMVAAALIRQVPPRLLAVTTAGDVLEFGAGAPKTREEFQNMHASCLAVSTSGLVAVGGTARSAGTGGSGVVGLWPTVFSTT